MLRSLLQGLLVAALVALGALPAAAQTTETPAPDTVRVNTPDNRARAIFNDGNALLSSGDHEGALAKFEEGLRVHPRSLSNQLGRGLALEQLGRQDEAVAAFERTAEMAEAQGNTDYAASARERLGRYAVLRAMEMVQSEQTIAGDKAEAALPLFEAAAESGAEGAAFHYQYARVLNALGRHADAVAHAREAAETTTVSDKSAFYIELGLAERGAGNTDAARAAFEQARTGSWSAWADHYLGELDAAAGGADTGDEEASGDAGTAATDGN